MKFQKSKKSKIGRNALCPCGSGLKYKKCCLKKGKLPLPKTFEGMREFYHRQYKIRLKDKADIQGIKRTGRLVTETLELVEASIQLGMVTDEINAIVHEFTIKNGAKPAPLRYRGYPKSTCVSVNEVICHGIPGNRVLMDGDIVNVDITSVLKGYFADANKTFFVGTPGPCARKIVEVSKESMRLGMSMVRPGNTIGDIGWAIQNHAEREGTSVVREFVGHGVGFAFHESPQVPHYGKKGDGIPLVPGMVFTIEPMINLGKKELYLLKDKWTAVTKDGSLSAQFEQTVLVTEDGFESLTPYE